MSSAWRAGKIASREMGRGDGSELRACKKS